MKLYLQTCSTNKTILMYTFLRLVLMSNPAMKAVPSVGLISPVKILNVVVLPAPVEHIRYTIK